MPTLNMQLLDRTSQELAVSDPDKLVCVYPLSAEK